MQLVILQYLQEVLSFKLVGVHVEKLFQKLKKQNLSGRLSNNKWNGRKDKYHQHFKKFQLLKIKEWKYR